MKRPSILKLAAAGIVVLLSLNLAVVTLAVVILGSRLGTGTSALSRSEMAEVTQTTIRAHPELVRQALLALIKKPAGSVAQPADESHVDHSAAIAANAATLLRSAHQVVLGNASGSTTLVQFFDYNCGYCRRALPDTMALLKDNSKLRIVLKEYPILGANSLDAAHVAIALRMQDPSGSKYTRFHELLLSGGVADKQQALATAKQVGADMTRLNRDIDSPEVKSTLDETSRLASALGITGTPTYVVGNEVVVGAVGSANLEAKIAALHENSMRASRQSN